MEHKLISPWKSALFGLLFWIILYLISPIYYKYPVSLFSILIILSSYLLFFLGYFIGYSVRLYKSILPQPRLNKKLFKFFFAITLFSVLLIFFDKIFLRGLSLSNGIFENREILEINPPTLIGVVGNIFKAGLFFSLFLYYQYNLNNVLYRSTLYLILLYYIFESFLIGSRSIPVFYLTLTILILRHFGKIKINLKYVTYGLVLGVTFFVVLTELFIKRTMEFTETRDRAIDFILQRASYMDYTGFTPSFLEFVKGLKSYYLQSFFIGLATFYSYYLHSLVEFAYLIDNYKLPPQWGTHTFFVITKFFQVIFGVYDGREFDYIPRPGKYTTFFGDIYMDFKSGILVFMILFGFWQARLVKRVKVKESFIGIPLVLFLCMLNFIMPVFNLIYGGSGIYMILGFILLALVYRILSFKLKLYNA